MRTIDNWLKKDMLINAHFPYKCKTIKIKFKEVFYA